MEGDKTTSKKGAESFVALSKFFHEAKTKCFDSCVLDFQNDNIGLWKKNEQKLDSKSIWQFTEILRKSSLINYD